MSLRLLVNRMVVGVNFYKNWNILSLKGKNSGHHPLQHVKSSYLSNWTSEISRKENVKKEDASTSKEDRKKKTGPKITLIGTDDSISVIGLEEAQKIASRRNLRLVRMVEYDTKTQRPIYRLMTIAEFNQEYTKEKKASKSSSSKREKLLNISSRIDKHDLESKVKMIEKWLIKDYEVRVILSGNEMDMSAADAVYKSLEDYMKGKARLLQKRTIRSDIKFHIKSLPVDKMKSIPEMSETKDSQES